MQFTVDMSADGMQIGKIIVYDEFKNSIEMSIIDFFPYLFWTLFSILTNVDTFKGIHDSYGSKRGV